MPARPMPAAEHAIDARLVRGLLEDQHPDLAGLPLAPLAVGWDNALYRLGSDLSVRLPRRQLGADAMANEQAWLPQLAPALPLPVPVPLRTGGPGRGYPWTWSVCRFLPGEMAALAPPRDPGRAAVRLGAFLAALHVEAPSGAPRSPFRGGPLPERTAVLEERLRALEGAVDGDAIRARWQAWVDTPPWPGPPRWTHGDLHPANLLVEDGEIAAVIDFGDLNAGDPAGDLSVAWMLLPPAQRLALRDAHGGVDADTWRRARAWALYLSIAFLEGSADHPLIREIGQRTLAAVLAEAV